MKGEKFMEESVINLIDIFWIGFAFMNGIIAAISLNLFLLAIVFVVLVARWNAKIKKVIKQPGGDYVSKNE